MIKEISVFKERKVNIGNYETVGLSVGCVISLDEKDSEEKAYEQAEAFCDVKLDRFVDKWKAPQKFIDKMNKEKVAKEGEIPF